MVLKMAEALANFKTYGWRLFKILVYLSFLSCQNSPSINGKWHEIGKTGAIEFNIDNTFNAIDDMGMSVSGIYHIDGSGNMRLEIQHSESNTEIINLQIKIESDELTFITAGKR